MSAGARRWPTGKLLFDMIVREQFDNGLCLLTESMPDVRSVSFGAWLTRGSRHESDTRSGIAHFIEHMLFKGTASRSAEDIAQEIDSLGGQLDAFTAKECASYYVKVLDEHLPRAVDVLADLLLHPAFDADDIEREKKWCSKRSRWWKTRRTISCTSCLPNGSGRVIRSGGRFSGSRRPSTNSTAPRYASTSTAPTRPGNLVLAAAGHVDHAAVRDLVGNAFGGCRSTATGWRPPRPPRCQGCCCGTRRSSSATSVWG